MLSTTLPVPSRRDLSVSLRTVPDGATRRIAKSCSIAVVAVRPSIFDFSPCSQGSTAIGCGSNRGSVSCSEVSAGREGAPQ